VKNQERTPLLDILLARARRGVTSFHTPGHKNGQGIDKRLRGYTGRNVYKLDVTVFPEVDSLHDPVGAIKKAQALMADAYGVKYSQFLVNGSSVGNMAMLMAACSPGDSVILSRNAHKSTLSGVIMSGVWPIWIQPKIDQHLDIIFDSDAAQIEQALHQFPEAKAVFVTSPTYHGVTTDLKKIAEICHARGKLLLVDEAHGPHLKFHKDLPISAVEAGADLCVQSTHKILSALSQGSVLHINSDLVEISRVRKILSLLQTTSPNYLILASLDAARRQVFFQGEKIFTRLMRLAEEARERINRLQHVYCLTQGEIRAKGYDLDVTKLTINVTRMGLAGHDVEQLLAKDYGVQVDCADIFNLIAIMGTGTTRQDVEKLISGLEDLDKKEPGHERNWVLQLPSLSTEMAMTPRDVFLAQRTKRVALSKAAGHISAQTLTPYPPGIPVLIPGERITQEIVDFLVDLAEKDIRISGQETEELRTVKVVATR
jgi:arginine decarboxylase